MSPLNLLAILTGITGVAYGREISGRQRSSTALRELARDWGMNFGRGDSFRLTPRIARQFPVPGAANLQVINVIYGTRKNHYHYVFTAEYTVGVIRGKRRACRVASFIEPRDRGHAGAILLAPARLPILDQYKALAPVQAAS